MDLYNWDMVCAVSCEELNKNLKKSIFQNYGEFEFTDAENRTITGKFDGWEIFPGGNGQQLVLITPISYGSVITNVMGVDVDFIVDGLCPKIRVELAFINAGKGQDTHLKFNLVQAVSDINIFGHGEVVVLDNDANNLYPDDRLLTKIFCEVMVSMLIARSERLDYVFSELLTIPSDKNNAWMKLHVLQYAYNEKINGELGVLAVLGILENNPSPPSTSDLQLVFDTNLIREGGSIGFLLSKRIFTEYVIMAGLPKVFKGSSVSQFKIDGNSIKENFVITLERIHSYQPIISQFLMNIIDDRIVLSYAIGRCVVVPGGSYSGSYVDFMLSGTYEAKLYYSGNSYCIYFASVNEPQMNVSVSDSMALTFWVFGGWAVDALCRGIAKELKYRSFEFSHTELVFDIYPIKFNDDSKYTTCGLAENFYMRD